MFWVKSVLDFEWAVSERGSEWCGCCKQHIGFGSRLLSIRKDLRLTLLVAELNYWFVSWPRMGWGMEPHGANPGCWRTEHTVMPECGGNPRTKYKSRRALPAHLCRAINLLLSLSQKSMCLGELQLLGEIPMFSPQKPWMCISWHSWLCRFFFWQKLFFSAALRNQDLFYCLFNKKTYLFNKKEMIKVLGNSFTILGQRSTEQKRA